ncbi:MAG: urease accessory protein UreD [Vicinamibacterales bacterium]
MRGAALADPTFHAASDVTARASLHVVRHAGRSVVTRALAHSPLRLLTPSNHGDAAWVFLSTYGGGFVGGDALDLDVHVGDRATALIQTQASTKVYRSPKGARSTLQATLGRGARLLVLPDPTVCFAGATFEQTQTFDVPDDGSLVVMDWMTAGRRAAGERWAFDRYVSRITIRRGATRLLADAIELDARDGPLLDRMTRFECLCSIVLLGPDVERAAALALERVAALPLRVRGDLLTSAAPLGETPAAGCVVRLAGVSVEEVARAARGYLDFVPGLLGDDPWARKW